MKSLLRKVSSLPVIGKCVFKLFGKKSYVVTDINQDGKFMALTDDFGQMHFKTEEYAAFVAKCYYEETGKVLSIVPIICL